MEKNNINISAEVSIKIFNIVKDFDFAKVVKVMELLDWQYALPKPHYPDEDELSNKAFKYLIDVYNGFWNHEFKNDKHFIYTVSTGGFEYSYWYDFEDKEHCFEMKFVVEEYKEY